MKRHRLQKTPEDVVRVAREYIGTPYHHHGRVKGVGIDCVGLTWCVSRDLGFSIGDNLDYTVSPEDDRLERTLERLGLIRLSEIVPGSMPTFEYVKPGVATHVGIATGDTLVHVAAAGRLRVVEHRLDRLWLSRVRSVWGYPGVRY